MTNSSSAESTGTWRLIQPEEVLDMAVNDIEFLTELIDLFVALAPEQMPDIRQAIENHDAGLLAEVAHAYKGTVGNYTQTGPYPLLQALENDGKSADLQASQSKFQTLEQEINALLNELENLKTEVNQSF